MTAKAPWKPLDRECELSAARAAATHAQPFRPVCTPTTTGQPAPLVNAGFTYHLAHRAMHARWAAELHDVTNPALGRCDSQAEFEFILDLLFDGLERGFPGWFSSVFSLLPGRRASQEASVGVDGGRDLADRLPRR